MAGTGMRIPWPWPLVLTRQSRDISSSRPSSKRQPTTTSEMKMSMMLMTLSKLQREEQSLSLSRFLDPWHIRTLTCEFLRCISQYVISYTVSVYHISYHRIKSSYHTISRIISNIIWIICYYITCCHPDVTWCDDLKSFLYSLGCMMYHVSILHVPTAILGCQMVLITLMKPRWQLAK